MDVRAILSVKSFYLNVSLLEEKSQCTYTHRYVPVTQSNRLHELKNTNVSNIVHVSEGLSIALSSTPGLFVLFAFSKGKEVKEETIFVIQFLWTEATVSLCIFWTEKFKPTKLIQHSSVELLLVCW